MTTNRHLKGQRGNALFLILIAVALFAALSYAVTRSGRGSGGIDREQALIAASQITQYPAALRTSITRMIVTGTQVSTLTFAPADTTDAGVFSASGGGGTLQAPPANIGTATTWRYKTAPGAGWYIHGIGTDTSGGKDVFAFLNGLTLPVCTQILRGLGLNGTPLVEATAVDFDTGATNEGLATQTGGVVAGNASPGAANAHVFFAHNAAPQAFACTRNGAAGNYVYYHALYEQ